MPTYAHRSLIRTAHESALLAYWLVEPGIDSATGLARTPCLLGLVSPSSVAVAIARAYDYEERRKFEESIGAKARPAKQVQARQGQTGRPGTQDPLPGMLAFLGRCDCYTEPLVGSLQTARRVNNISQHREGSFGTHIIIVERPARARLRQTCPVSALKRADVPVPEF